MGGLWDGVGGVSHMRSTCLEGKKVYWRQMSDRLVPARARGNAGANSRNRDSAFFGGRGGPHPVSRPQQMIIYIYIFGMGAGSVYGFAFLPLKRSFL